VTRRGKIVCTLGPATGTDEMVKALVDAGMDVARLNFSHGEHADHAAAYRRVRHASEVTGRAVGVLADLQGPKIRLGRFAETGTRWANGETVRITVEDCVGSHDRVSTTYKELADDARPGDRLLIDDGKVALVVDTVDGNDVVCTVTEGGPVSNNKGLSMPGMKVSVPALSEKDIADLEFALNLGVDMVALSFVRSAADVDLVHAVMDRIGRHVPVIAKLEKPEAVADLEAIVLAFDAIMVARGDLGVELPLEEVPLVQKRAIEIARENAKPVIVATQMLESMMNHPRPTRAEVTDVAGAALLSADAVMLSGETAAGAYPLEAVRTMDRVLREIEQHQWREGRFARDAIVDRDGKVHVIRESMAHAAVELARDLGLEAVVVPTRTGTTARIVAAHRPLAPTVGVCSSAAVCRRMTLHWGIVPFLVEAAEITDWRGICELIAVGCGLGRPGTDVLLVSGFNDDPVRNEPVLKLLHRPEQV
jgi:pyruvate kinase